MFCSSLSDGLDLIVEPTNIAWIDTYCPTSRLDCREHVLGLEMDVRNNRDGGLLRDYFERSSVLISRTCHTHNVAPSCSQLRDLLKCRPDVMRLRGGHGLNRNRRAAPHRD